MIWDKFAKQYFIAANIFPIQKAEYIQGSIHKIHISHILYISQVSFGGLQIRQSTTQIISKVIKKQLIPRIIDWEIFQSLDMNFCVIFE